MGQIKTREKKFMKEKMVLGALLFYLVLLIVFATAGPFWALVVAGLWAVCCLLAALASWLRCRKRREYSKMLVGVTASLGPVGLVRTVLAWVFSDRKALV